MNVEKRGTTAVAWLKGTKHLLYEDRYRILNRDIPLVGHLSRGELYAVFDGIGSAPEGRHAAQVMAELLIEFFRKPEAYPASGAGILSMLLKGNAEIHGWGCKPGTDIPMGGCAGTVIWIIEDSLYTFHAGDTTCLLVRDGIISELTRPHQTPDGAIFRYFGLGSSLKLDAASYPLEESDRILLISDGIIKAFDPPKILNIVDSHVDISRAAGELVRLARTHGSTDDITAMVVEIEEIWECGTES